MNKAIATTNMKRTIKALRPKRPQVSIEASRIGASSPSGLQSLLERVRLREEQMRASARHGTSPEEREERIRMFRELVASMPRDTPLLSDEAISREAIYGDR